MVTESLIFSNEIKDEDVTIQRWVTLTSCSLAIYLIVASQMKAACCSRFIRFNDTQVSKYLNTENDYSFNLISKLVYR